MKSYKPEHRGTHTIRYTLQHGEYKGTFCTEIGGNCKGGALLDSDVFEALDNILITQSDCELKYNEEDDYFSCVLHDENGNECIIDDLTEEDMAEYLVCIEIIDYQPE